MSWDASLECTSCSASGYCGDREWNYTHNCNFMANVVLDESGFDRPLRNGRKDSFWSILNGMEGPSGAKMLDTIIRGLEADPLRFDAMNPENGWGSRESFVAVLRQMRKAVPEYPTKWRCTG